MSSGLFIFLCKTEGLEVVTEYKFHPKRKWRLDYYVKSGVVEVGLEVEGGVWTGGRHTSGAGFMKDMEKYNEATRMGIYIIRCVPSSLKKQVEAAKIVLLIKDIIEVGNARIAKVD